MIDIAAFVLSLAINAAICPDHEACTERPVVEVHGKLADDK